MITFNKPPYTGNEDQYVIKAMRNDKISGDGPFTQLCHEWFETRLKCQKVLLTPSCTAALEMAALLIDIRPGDEIIMPSYTFVSTANAFVLRGAKIIFVDIRSDTMNIDESKIEQAVNDRTRAIVPVHYAGVSCEMDVIMDIAQRHNLYVIEDAAQGMMSTYKGKALGTIGHLGTYSFHDTKNYTSGGEGGLLLINDENFTERAEIIREKGTNRSQFFRGMADKYSWVDIGSSYLPSDLQAAYLWGQLEKSQEINQNRLAAWSYYYEQLKALELQEKIQLPTVPASCQHNGHMFYIKAKNIAIRSHLIQFLKEHKITAVFHYIPLHSSIAGKQFGAFSGEEKITTIESERLLRLPLWYGISREEQDKVISTITSFFQ